jgi:hypothetical protein
MPNKKLTKHKKNELGNNTEDTSGGVVNWTWVTPRDVNTQHAAGDSSGRVMQLPTYATRATIARIRRLDPRAKELRSLEPSAKLMTGSKVINLFEVTKSEEQN